MIAVHVHHQDDKSAAARSAPLISNDLYYLLAIMASSLMLLMVPDALITMAQPAYCANPRVAAFEALLLLPFLCILPYCKLLWAKNLTSFGVLARGFVTCSAAVWGFGMALIFSNTIW